MTAKYLNAGKLILAVLLAWFVVSRTDLDQVRAVFENISARGLVIYFLLFLLSVMAKALQYRIVIGHEVAYPRVLNVVVLQNVVSNFLASSAGIASYVALLRVEHGVKVGRAMMAFILTKVGDLTVLFLLLFGSLWGVWSRIQVVRWVTILLLVGTALFLVTFSLVVIFRGRFAGLMRSLSGRLRLSRFSVINKGLDVLDALARQEQAEILMKMGGVLAGSSVYLIVTFFWLYSGLRMFGIHLDIWEISFSSAYYHLITYVPIQIFGGLGVTEAGMLYVYHLFVSSQAELAAVLIGLRIVSALMNLALLLYLPLYGFLSGSSEKKS